MIYYLSRVNRMAKQKISVIVPCYNESAALPYFFEEIGKLLLVKYPNISASTLTLP